MTTVLVLGAGASNHYGYPLGRDLRERLINLAADHDSQQAKLICTGFCNWHDVRRFSEEFRRSHRGSIDDFLSRRPEFVEIGKRAIAAQLLACEKPHALEQIDGGWYAYLLHRVFRTSWDELNFSRLKIITFNYDRSLEHFLRGALKSTSGRSEGDVLEKLEALEVLHVYGSLGPTSPTQARYFPYGEQSESALGIAASAINIIPEGRDDSPVIERARELLFNAEKIAFLGFGFDETNLARLNAGWTCRVLLDEPGSVRRRRRVAATVKGLTRAEQVKIATEFFQGSGFSPIHEGPPPSFVDADCRQMLRETLILD